MLVALIETSYSEDYPNYNNFYDVIEMEFLPNINSLMELDGLYFKIEHYRPITFQAYDNKEIMCVFIKPITFDSDCCYDNLEILFSTYKSKERKYKIKKVLEN